MRKLFLSVLCALVALTSCVKDAEIFGNPDIPDMNENRNTSFVFTIPNSSASKTRSVEDSGEHDQGIEEEYVVNNVTVYLFDASTEVLVDSYKIEGISLVTDKSSDFIVEYTSNKFDVEEGHYNIFAVANGVSQYHGINQSDFLEFVDDATYSTGLLTAVPDAGFVMTNRAAENLGVAVTKNSDVVVTISLERVIAKVNVYQNQDSFELKNNEDEVYASVKLHNYKMVNLATEYFLYRHVADLLSFIKPTAYTTPLNFGDVSNSNGYVIDPYFFNKNVATVNKFTNADGFFAQPLATVSDKAGWREMNSASLPSINYCLENTLYQDAQVNGYTTGVVYQAVVTPTEILTATGTTDNTPAMYYYCNYKFYNNIAALKVRLGGEISIGDVPISESTSTEELQTIGIVRLTTSLCYYNYWIKHFDNNDDQKMGVMEFGIVRNNHYKIGVNSIGGMGNGVPEVDPGNPDETDQTLTVNFEVIPWVVRDQGDIEL